MNVICSVKIKYPRAKPLQTQRPDRIDESKKKKRSKWKWKAKVKQNTWKRTIQRGNNPHMSDGSMVENSKSTRKEIHEISAKINPRRPNMCTNSGMLMMSKYMNIQYTCFYMIKYFKMKKQLYQRATPTKKVNQHEKTIRWSKNERLFFLTFAIVRYYW